VEIESGILLVLENRWVDRQIDELAFTQSDMRTHLDGDLHWLHPSDERQHHVESCGCSSVNPLINESAKEWFNGNQSPASVTDGNNAPPT